MKIGDVQVEFEGTSENIAKLMNKEMIEFTKKLGDATKQSPPLTASTQKFATKTQEEAQKTQSDRHRHRLWRGHQPEFDSAVAATVAYHLAVHTTRIWHAAG